MAIWLDRLLSRINGTAEPRERRRRDDEPSVGFIDSGSSSPSSGDSTEHLAGPGAADTSFDAAYSGGESGGGGASADFGGGDSGGGDGGGGDGGGGDGGGGD